MPFCFFQAGKRSPLSEGRSLLFNAKKLPVIQNTPFKGSFKCCGDRQMLERSTGLRLAEVKAGLVHFEAHFLQRKGSLGRVVGFNACTIQR